MEEREEVVPDAMDIAAAESIVALAAIDMLDIMLIAAAESIVALAAIDMLGIMLDIMLGIMLMVDD